LYVNVKSRLGCSGADTAGRLQVRRQPADIRRIDVSEVSIPMGSQVSRGAGCQGCREPGLAPDFTMAFQPIIDLATGGVYAHEALVRPIGGGGAHQILEQITENNRYAFDQACRVKAITLAAQLGMQSLLSINFLPNAVYQPAACIRATLAAAERSAFRLDRIIFEVTEGEPSRDPGHLAGIFAEYKRHGMLTAIDDFGAGHSGLNLLAQFQPDIVKIDMALTRNIHADRTRRVIVSSITAMCAQLGITVIAEGIESVEEVHCLWDLGIRRFQGYYFARPEIERLPTVRTIGQSLGSAADELSALRA
jgi:EAL domain-containing protein (putative c-di-GMP-specific phosphodiesterase class I)